jgi:hypothetical protein
MPSLSQQMARLAAIFGGNQNSYGLPMANRNYFVDGNMDSIITSSVAVAAAGSSNGVAAMYYGIAGATNGGTLSASWSLGYDPVGMSSPVANSLVWAQTTAPTTAPSITQRVENVQTLQGRSATFSCWLWCASGTQTITNIEVLQHFGSGGSPSADVTVNVPVNWVLTTTPQRFSARLDIPSVLGKTLGTNGGTHYLQVYLQYPIAANYTISTTQWQLEQSSPNAPATGMPTAFEYRGVQAELARVQRYYETGNFRVRGQDANAAIVTTLSFKQVKRSAPSVTGMAATLTVSNAYADAAQFASQAITGTYDSGSFTWTADARL